MKSEIKPLTGIRGVACIWVLLFHLNLWLPTKLFPAWLADRGYLGVDIFFVLSGYVLAMVYGQDRHLEYGLFLARRVMRVYPLHILVMTGLAIEVSIGRNLGLGQGNSNPWATFLPVLLLLQPVMNIESNWNSVSWSIGVELFCYLLFPIIYPYIRRASRTLSIVALTGLLSIETWINIYAPGEHVTGLSAFVRGISGFFAGCFLLKVITVNMLLSSRYFNVLGIRLLHWVGTVSFSIYLLHLPLINMMNVLIKRFGTHVDSRASSLMAASLIVLLVPAIAWVTFNFVEEPCRKVPAAFYRRLRRTNAVRHDAA